MRIHDSRPRRGWLLLAVLLPLLCLAGCAARTSRSPATDRAVAASPTPMPTFTPVPTPSPTFTTTSTPTPTLLPTPTSTPSRTRSGAYDNLAENHNGTFHLRREGNAVYAIFRTDRSPVQFLARDQPEVLLTVPEGFRPAVAVTWEVSAEPVLPDGTPRPDQPARRVFRMHVDTAGQVRYVDDAGVEGAGHLGYDTALAWPLAGTEPRLCDRHWNIREGILAAVQALEDATVPCMQVDWAHLARIRTLSLDAASAEFARHDLVGLTNLTALRLPSIPIHGATSTYINNLLAHTPRLQTLRMEGTGLANLPENLLRHTPLLAHLSLRNNSRGATDLPDGLLVDSPHLESLHLESRYLEGGYPSATLAPLLTHVPRLTRLTVAPSTSLPETFLAAVPHLTHLTVQGDFDPCAAPALLSPVPHLRHFAVHMAAEDGKLACLDRALHLHTPALTELHVELQDLRDLDSEVLPGLPRLTHLTLDVGGLTRLPAQLLAEAPELTHLTLRGEPRDAALTLPEGFFAHTPRLTALSLHANRLQDLPPDLLTPLPELQQVQLVTEDVTALPTWFLDRVTELRVDTGRLALPADLLMHSPHLKVLHLEAPWSESLPEHFLTYAPRLVELRLDVPSLQTLPPTFLSHAPRLEVFHLYTGFSVRLPDGRVPTPSVLYSFPESFLTQAPRLVELRLEVPSLRTLPPSFLGHAPRLEILELKGTHDYYGNIGVQITSLPANFLTNAPRLQHLDLGDLEYVETFPPGFLSGSPQLRYLNLDANGTASLPADFLTRHPRLERVRILANNVPALPQGFLSHSPNLMDLQLELQRVEALPENFLAETSRLWNLEIGMHRVEALPPGFLADAPHLTHLNLRALNLTAWPADFLAHAPRIRTLGLAMPLLEPLLTPDHRLWNTLQTTSDRVKVIRPDPFHHLERSESHPQCFPSTIKLGDILEVEGRAPDDHGNVLLLVSRWRNRDLFTNFYDLRCRYLIDARFTAPTLEVCAAHWDPDECIPAQEPYAYRNLSFSPRG